MKRVYAFIDESGAFGWNLENPSVSRFFILTAVIVEETELEVLTNEAKKIKEKFFQTGEMKSSKIGTNYERRKKILDEISKLNCKFFPLICDKEMLLKENYPGLQFKQPFYKFLNNIIDTELVKAFPVITIVSDSTGNDDFIQSFIEYMKKKVIIPDLFSESDIQLRDSKSSCLIQIADIISGTLQYVYDKRKKVPNNYDFIKQIEKQLIRIEIYPRTFENYVIERNVLASEYDIEIANICFNQAKSFIIKNEKKVDDVETCAQVLTLKYLLFRFMNNNLRHYISTKEIIKYLKNTVVGEISSYYFRTKIIGPLRDLGVIISSSAQGYKIPTTKKDLIDYFDHNKSILLPMLYRMKKCRDLIQLGTNDNIDLLEEVGFETVKKLFSSINSDIPMEI